MIDKFKFWCQKTLPAVYDDSLSYYELLCKIMNKLNETIDVTNTQDEKLIELQNWFNNLDVQDEINEKLDNMVESGELQEILQQYFDDVVKTFKTFNGKVIYFSDSYGTTEVSTHNWVDELNSRLGTEIFSEHREGGAGFLGRGNSATRSWTTTLQNMVNSSTLEQRKDVKAIIIGGGFNDRGFQDSQLYSAMNTFNNIAKNNFPNATIYLACIGWTIDTETTDLNIASGFLYNLQNVLPIYSRCGEFGWKFLSNCEYVMHDSSLFKEDKIHPNDSGGIIIAGAMYSAINGCCDVHKNWTTVQVSSYTEYFTAKTTGNPSMRLDNEIITLIPTTVAEGTRYARAEAMTFEAGTFYPFFNILMSGQNKVYGVGDQYRPQYAETTLMYNNTTYFKGKLGFKKGQFGFVPSEKIENVVSVTVFYDTLLFNTTQM